MSGRLMILTTFIAMAMPLWGYCSQPLSNNTQIFDTKSLYENKLDISEIMDEKFSQYDKARGGGYRVTDPALYINYNSNIHSTLYGASDPMSEQKRKLDTFKAISDGPRTVEGFYGVTMKVPLHSKSKKK